MKYLTKILLVLSITAVFLSCAAKKEPITIRISTSQVGPTVMENVFKPLMAQFEKENPGVTVTWDDSYGDDYQFAGLPAALQSNTPPDIYFEWGGYRVLEHVRAGEALDISDLAVKLEKDLVPAAWSGFVYDGKTYGVAYDTASTIMIWYDRVLFAKLGLTPPKTWAEFEAVCASLLKAGITPLWFGNSDAWPAGNFVSAIIYRVAGDERAAEIFALSPGSRLDDPDFVKALGIAGSLAKKGYVNRDLNTLGYEASAAAMFTGKAGMYPMGSWYYPELVPLYNEDVSKIDHSFFNLPPIPGGKGDQSSIIGVSNGMVVNAKTAQPELAKKFLALMMSRAYMDLMVKEGMIVSLKNAIVNENPGIQLSADFVRSIGKINSPPDTGYNLTMATALYSAIAKVLEGEDPAAALAEAESTTAALRK